ncbi:MAG: hypothetical protein EOP82_01845 [Variovorax sp.]|nr:MAG: hypothetical protein EOP82_01845 [Variovorax sp.]
MHFRLEAALQDMGAEGVTVSPKPDSTMPGNFVVRGEWSYNERNLAALAACLQRERYVYRALDKTVSLEPGLRGRLRGMLLRDDRNGA